MVGLWVRRHLAEHLEQEWNAGEGTRGGAGSKLLASQLVVFHSQDIESGFRALRSPDGFFQ